MRFLALPLLSAIVVLSGCASRAPVAEQAPATVVEPVAIATTSRFDMRQHGRRMSVEDFDAWMRARGIRIAKGPQTKRSSLNVSPNEAKFSTARAKQRAKQD